MAFKFEKLEVWHEAVELSGLVNDLSEKFPAKELYVLSAQIKRAADSVALNIAEGSTGQTTLEFKKFLNYAIRSAIEVVSCLLLQNTEESFRKTISRISTSMLMRW